MMMNFIRRRWCIIVALQHPRCCRCRRRRLGVFVVGLLLVAASAAALLLCLVILVIISRPVGGGALFQSVKINTQDDSSSSSSSHVMKMNPTRDSTALLVNTPGCKIPNIDPFDASIRQFVTTNVDNDNTSSFIVRCQRDDSTQPITSVNSVHFRQNAIGLNFPAKILNSTSHLSILLYGCESWTLKASPYHF